MKLRGNFSSNNLQARSFSLELKIFTTVKRSSLLQNFLWNRLDDIKPSSLTSINFLYCESFIKAAIFFEKKNLEDTLNRFETGLKTCSQLGLRR
jgi:hypothetical protein